MKYENWASPDVCQKLKAAGITINTDFYWFAKGDGTWSVEMRDYFTDNNVLFAVSMAELWRELPVQLSHNILLYEPRIDKFEELTYCYYHWFGEILSGSGVAKENPADALAELLIFVKGQMNEI